MENQWNGLDSIYMDIFDSSSSDDDMFITTMYAHLLDELDDDDDDADADADDDDEDDFLTGDAALTRDRGAAHRRLHHDYFRDDSLYDGEAFKRRFRLSRYLFLRIFTALENRYPFFRQRNDARGGRDFSGLQKCTAALRLMAYGSATNSLDEYLQMSEKTARESMYRFAIGVIDIFGDVYLRRPNTHDVQRLYAAHEERHGFPGMLGSLGCTHWDWRNCPKGMYTGGQHGVPSLVLEAVASQDLWIWHAYFGIAGSNNNRNVLDIFDDMLAGKAPDASFVVNGNNYRFGYYLTDGIYPPFATIVKASHLAIGVKEERFSRRQLAARKDVERAFGVLKSNWHIVKNASRPFHLDNLRSIMYACIIMHNMIIEEEGRHICPHSPDVPRHALYEPGTDSYMHRVVEIQDARIHDRLQNDLSLHVFYNPMNVDDEELKDVVVGDDVPDAVGPYDDVPDEELEDDDD